MTDHPPPVVQRGSAVLIRGAALPLYRATLVLITLSGPLAEARFVPAPVVPLTGLTSSDPSRPSRPRAARS